MTRTKKALALVLRYDGSSFSSAEPREKIRVRIAKEPQRKTRRENLHECDWLVQRRIAYGRNEVAMADGFNLNDIDLGFAVNLEVKQHDQTSIFDSPRRKFANVHEPLVF